MHIKQIEKNISINAGAEKVWEVLFTEPYISKYYRFFSEGSSAQTDWITGSKVIFSDPSGNGLLGKIMIAIPREQMSIEYEGVVSNGIEDHDGPLAQMVKGGKEEYRLFEKNGITELFIRSDMTEDMFEAMSLAWDKALQAIRDMAESNG
jgi:hypothetical protein